MRLWVIHTNVFAGVQALSANEGDEALLLNAWGLPQVLLIFSATP